MLHLDPDDLAGSLKAARTARGLSLQELADRSDLELSTVWRIENGDTLDPAGSTLRKLERALAQ